jgi:hypothetical protein
VVRLESPHIPLFLSVVPGELAPVPLRSVDECGLEVSAAHIDGQRYRDCNSGLLDERLSS